VSGTTQVNRNQKGKTNLDFTEARDSECYLRIAMGGWSTQGRPCGAWRPGAGSTGRRTGGTRGRPRKLRTAVRPPREPSPRPDISLSLVMPDSEPRTSVLIGADFQRNPFRFVLKGCIHRCKKRSNNNKNVKNVKKRDRNKKKRL